MVARLIFGTMNFGWRTPQAEAVKMVEVAIERGLTEFDTANVYADGEAERILGRAVVGRRGSVQLTTKTGLWKNEGLAPERIVQSLDESLARLQTDYVDCLLLHAPDERTPVEKTLEGVARVLEKKKTLSWGVSNFSAWQILEILFLGERLALPSPAQSQVLYNLAVRQLELEYFAFARRFPIRTTVYNPLAGGLFTTRSPSATARLTSNRHYQQRYGSAALAAFAERCATHADQHGMTLQALALRWVMNRRGVDGVLLGPATVAHLEEALSIVGALSQEVRESLDREYLGLTGTTVSYAR